jgi:ABC-type transport system substrate-binding protein
VANPKLADLNVRLGIQHAFNIDKMIETVLRGDYDRATTFGSGFGEFTDMQLPERAYDIAKARDYFAKAVTASRGRTASCKTTRGAADPGAHLHQPGALQAADRAQRRGQEGGAGSGAQSGGAAPPASR